MMKKFYYALMVMLMALVSVGFAACGDDEAEIPEIVGTWQYDNSDMLGVVVYLIQFTKDGKFHQVVNYINGQGKPESMSFHGTYHSVNLHRLAITINNDSEGVSDTIYWDYIVEGDVLTIIEQDPLTFIRVADSIIKPYL